MRGRRIIGTLVAAIAVLGAACTPLATPPAPGSVTTAATHEPVVIVPGWALLCQHGKDEWNAWKDAFVQLGYRRDQVTVYDFDTCQPDEVTAAGLGTYIDSVLAASGASKVDLIAHSMGVLPARWCMRFGECAGKVDHLVTLAGANHGTLWAGLCGAQFWSRSCPEMQWDGPFLTRLNAAPEVIPGVATSTYESWCDLAIVPFTSGELDGADNHRVSNCILHDDWKTDPTAIADVTSMLATGPAASAAASSSGSPAR